MAKLAQRTTIKSPVRAVPPCPPRSPAQCVSWRGVAPEECVPANHDWDVLPIPKGPKFLYILLHSITFYYIFYCPSAPAPPVTQSVALQSRPA